MHTLLGYRFDHLLLEKIPGSGIKQAQSQLLSIRLVVDNLEQEKNFFTRLLKIDPLVENEMQVLLPISSGTTINLLASTLDQKYPPVHSTPGLELDILVNDIQSIWKNTAELRHSPEKPPSAVGSRRMFQITSPAGILLRLWQ